MWIGTYTGGVNQVVLNKDNVKNVALGSINTVTEDKEGNYWLGTNDNGIIRYNPVTGERQSFTMASHGLSSDIIVTARSGHAALRHRLETLGVEVDEEKLNDIYQRFLALADKKKDVAATSFWPWAAAASSTPPRPSASAWATTAISGISSPERQKSSAPPKT